MYFFLFTQNSVIWCLNFLQPVTITCNNKWSSCRISHMGRSPYCIPAHHFHLPDNSSLRTEVNSHWLKQNIKMIISISLVTLLCTTILSLNINNLLISFSPFQMEISSLKIYRIMFLWSDAISEKILCNIFNSIGKWALLCRVSKS